MASLKDADALIELIDDDIASLNKDMSREGYDVCLCTLKMVKQYINALPTADPTKHGRWITDYVEVGSHTGGVATTTVTYCSVCDEQFDWRTPYCPNCGARMDEVENG